MSFEFTKHQQYPSCKPITVAIKPKLSHVEQYCAQKVISFPWYCESTLCTVIRTSEVDWSILTPQAVAVSIIVVVVELVDTGKWAIIVEGPLEENDITDETVLLEDESGIIVELALLDVGVMFWTVENNTVTELEVCIFEVGVMVVAMLVVVIVGAEVAEFEPKGRIKRDSGLLYLWTSQVPDNTRIGLNILTLSDILLLWHSTGRWRIVSLSDWAKV